MTRRLIAVLIVVGLGIGVWAVWPRNEAGVPTTTTPVAAVSTSSTTTLDDHEPTAPVVSTTTTPDNNRPVTVEEAEAILRELLVARYRAIRAEDREALRQIVASQKALSNGIDAFGLVPFTSRPKSASLHLEDVEILNAEVDCLVLAATVDPSAFIDIEQPSTSVFVLRKVATSWKWMSVWRHRGDLWEADCEALLESF